VNIDQQISITGALEKAQTRVIEGLYTELPAIEEPSNARQINTRRTGSLGLPSAQFSDRNVSEER